MNAGLVFLLRKQPLGWLRRLRRRARGPKGVLVILGAVAVAVLLIAPQVFTYIQEGGKASARVGAFRLWGPPALMLMAVAGMSSGTGLYFRRPEIDFLFPAPIGRRELLLYSVGGRAIVVFFSSLWIALFTLRHAPLWYGGFTGIFFGMMFLQLASQAASLGFAAVSLRMARRVRRVALTALAALLIGGVVWMLASLPETSMLGAVKGLAASRPVAIACSPACVFVGVFTSTTATSFAAWAAASVAVLVALFALIASFDVSYAESALRTSRRVQERLARARAGGTRRSVRGRRSLPRFPWFGGAGPILWQNCVDARRSLSGLAFKVAFLAVFPLVFVLVMQSGHGDERVLFNRGAAWIVVAMTLLMNQNIAFDFRRDLDRMAWLESLPLRPSMVALGQILPGAVLFTLIHAVMILATQLAVGVPTTWLPILVIVLFPINWMSVALDNVLFLWLPYRFAPNEAGQVQFLGRLMLVMFAKLFVLALACGLAALPGWLVWNLTDGALVPVGLAVGLVLAGDGVVLTWLAGHAFATFDLTKDLPQ